LLRRVDTDLRRYFDRERRETSAELRADRSELRVSQRELGRPGHRWDDRADLRDDYRDLRVEARALERLDAIERDFQSVHGLYGARALAIKRRVIDQLIAFERAELRQNAGERVEDRNELAESTVYGRDRR
jgi:hypothetical protein